MRELTTLEELVLEFIESVSRLENVTPEIRELASQIHKEMGVF